MLESKNEKETHFPFWFIPGEKIKTDFAILNSIYAAACEVKSTGSDFSNYLSNNTFDTMFFKQWVNVKGCDR